MIELIKMVLENTKIELELKVQEIFSDDSNDNSFN